MVIGILFTKNDLFKLTSQRWGLVLMEAIPFVLENKVYLNL